MGNAAPDMIPVPTEKTEVAQSVTPLTIVGSLEAPVDTLKDMFDRQLLLMEDLKRGDKLPEWPIDMTGKFGQRQIKELIWAMVEEMAEASFILKNRTHRFTDHTDVDFAHFKEELADALAYFFEICIFAGISPKELYEEFCKKNGVVRKRITDGY